MALVGPLSGSHGFSAVTGTIKTSLGLSGSLTKLHNGLSAFEAGSNITITSASNGAVTIASTGGGAVANYTNNGDNRIVTSVDSDTINGEANLTFDGTDFLIAAAGKIQLRDTGIYARSPADGELQLISDGRLGLSSSLNDNDAIGIHASAGGVDIRAAGAAGEDISLTNAAGSIVLTSGEAVVDSVKIDSAGGILLDYAAAGNSIRCMAEGTTFLVLSQSGGSAILSSSVDNKDIIFHGNDETEVFRIDGSANSILMASDKKIEFGSANETISGDGTDLSVASTGNINITSTVDEAASIFIRENAGTSGAILIRADQGTGATEGAASVQLLSDVGGVGLKSGLNGAGAIRITADAGTSETIVIHADQGNGDASIGLTSDAGGITLSVNSSKAVTVENGMLLPGADASQDLGSEAKRWRNVFTGDLHLKNDRGNWTLIEENTYLTLRNNNTGQRFKFLMELLPEDDWDPDGTWTEPI